MTDEPKDWPQQKSFGTLLLEKLDLRTTVALMVVQAFIIVLVLTMFIKLPVEQATLAIISAMFGSLMTKFGTVIDYLFGSSDGSKEQNKALIDGAKKKDDALIATATQGQSQ